MPAFPPFRQLRKAPVAPTAAADKPGHFVARAIVEDLKAGRYGSVSRPGFAVG